MRGNKVAKLLLPWYKKHGRNYLPWRFSITPYRVWLSEVMLQQTQVKTVIPYFEKFIAQYPSVIALTQASLDDVLHLWAGLGYYSRARNLHRAAKMITEKYHGVFPDNLDDLQKLPGVGRSTAGAIMAIAFNKKAAILDGNVKRILARYYAIDKPINDPKTIKQLWTLSEKILPAKQFDDYTQAMMDLGATICTRKNPNCIACPLQQECLAYQTKQQNVLPPSSKKTAVPTKNIHMLILQNNDHEILLEKRVLSGIWGGLWSLPECGLDEDIKDYCQQTLSVVPNKIYELDRLKHTFTHFHLNIYPLLIKIENIPAVMDNSHQIWLNFNNIRKLAMPAPITKLLHQLMLRETTCHTKYSVKNYVEKQKA